MSGEIGEIKVRYGLVVSQPIMLATLHTEPSTIAERVMRAAWTPLCIFGAILGCAVWTLFIITVFGAAGGSLSGLGGFVIGFTAFVIWDGRR